MTSVRGSTSSNVSGGDAPSFAGLVALENGDRLTRGEFGSLPESRVFPGLRLDVAALLASDLAGVLSALRDGLGTPEHADFVAR